MCTFAKRFVTIIIVKMLFNKWMNKMHILMACLGNKIGKFNHKKVNDYISDKLSKSEKVFRGLTIEEVLSNKFEVGKKIKFKRITSFSKESFIADEFAVERYKTNIVVEIDDSLVFEYSKHMCEILENLIENCDDDDELDKLYDNLGMVDYEREVFIPVSSEFTVKDINYCNKRNVHVITLI